MVSAPQAEVKEEKEEETKEDFPVEALRPRLRHQHWATLVSKGPGHKRGGDKFPTRASAG
eukprot:5392987-Amphidinium_carterae.1